MPKAERASELGTGFVEAHQSLIKLCRLVRESHQDTSQVEAVRRSDLIREEAETFINAIVTSASLMIAHRAIECANTTRHADAMTLRQTSPAGVLDNFARELRK